MDLNMFIVYLYSFINKKKVFVGLSENLNFHLELEKKFFNSIGLEINNITFITGGAVCARLEPHHDTAARQGCGWHRVLVCQDHHARGKRTGQQAI